jgi:hypothetical protein
MSLGKMRSVEWLVAYVNASFLMVVKRLFLFSFAFHNQMSQSRAFGVVSGNGSGKMIHYAVVRCSITRITRHGTTTTTRG